MKKLILLLLAAVMALGCAACAAKPYTPAGQATGNAELDEAVLALLQELCDPKADLVEISARSMISSAPALPTALRWPIPPAGLRTN